MPTSQTPRNNAPCLYLVIPCYNEEEVLPRTAPEFTAKMLQLIESDIVDDNSAVLFVDDGSSDNTWSVIEKFASTYECCEGLKLSRNCGHQSALLAGLTEALPHCDITISIDCDGQDDIEAINAMVEAYDQGSDVVYGVRSNRDTDTFFKRFTAEAFYHLLNSMGVDAIFNHADYRLLSHRALVGLLQFQEANLFLRGMVPLVGFPSTTVEYERQKRAAGESHYPLRKMIALAIDGITSLSIKPIRLITWLGLVFSLISIAGIIWTVTSQLNGNAVAGWASTLCAVLLLGGIQLLALGVIGEYIGRIYLETKRRPHFIIEQSTIAPSRSTNDRCSE